MYPDILLDTHKKPNPIWRLSIRSYEHNKFFKRERDLKWKHRRSKFSHVVVEAVIGSKCNLKHQNKTELSQIFKQSLTKLG